MVQYEEILSIIENMVAVIERSPHAFVSMSEEDLRQHFLVQLNGFNRTKNFSSVLRQIPDVVRKHSNFIREEPTHSETRFRFALHHRDDPDRQIVLTVLSFDVPT